MRGGLSAVRSLRRNESRGMYNRYSPGHGQSPNSVSFLWHDPSRVPPARPKENPAQQRPSWGITYVHSLSLTSDFRRHRTIPPLSPCHLPFFSPHVLLYFDSALAAHSYISPFMRALSPGTGGVVRIRKRTVIHEPTQRKRVRINTQFAFLTLPHNGCCWFGVCEGQKILHTLLSTRSFLMQEMPMQCTFLQILLSISSILSISMSIYLFSFCSDFNVIAVLMIRLRLCTKNNLVRVRIRSCVANLDAVLASNQKYQFFGIAIAEKFTNVCLKYWNTVSNSGLLHGSNLG